MTDHAHFIAAIIARPDDDLPRLIYADWLDENGECERAEFVRVQCELAQTKPFDGNEDHDCLYEPPCPWHKLRARERELLGNRDLLQTFKIDGLGGCWSNANHAVVWATGAGRAGEFYMGGNPRRGFIETIECDWGSWQRHCGAIRAATPLKKVRITTPPIIRAQDPNDHSIERWIGQFYPGIEFEFPRIHEPVNRP